jgi:hypothetical protein
MVWREALDLGASGEILSTRTKQFDRPNELEGGFS